MTCSFDIEKRKQFMSSMSYQIECRYRISVCTVVSNCSRRENQNATTMPVNLENKVKFACPHYSISVLMLITAIIAFVGTLAMKYEFSILSVNYLENFFGIPVLILIVGSGIIFANAVLGLITLWQRSRLGVLLFFQSTVCLLIAMILAMVLYVFSLKIEETMFQQLEDDMYKFETHKEVIDTIQLQMNCCGYNNYSDWTESTNIPQSCCVNKNCNTANSTEIQSIGCYEALYIFVCFRKWILAVILAVLGIIEVISITLSVTVIRDLRQKVPAPGVSTFDNEERNTLKRIRNPLGQNVLPTVDNNDRRQEPYVRRPTEQPPVLNYRSPHESFLRQAPQLRFDRRIVMPSPNYKNPYGVGRSPSITRH